MSGANASPVGRSHQEKNLRANAPVLFFTPCFAAVDKNRCFV